MFMLVTKPRAGIQDSMQEMVGSLAQKVQGSYQVIRKV